MIKINTQCKKINEIMKSVGDEFVYSQKYKDDREWWILCSFIKLYKRNINNYPRYAEKRKPNDPDFLTFTDIENEFHPIEIVETITLDRKRGKEYQDHKLNKQTAIVSIEPVEQPWKSMIENIHKKYLKKYQKNCWLLVYHNMSYYEISHYGYWHNTILYNFQEWYASNIIDYSKCPYESIYMINSSAKALVRSYPDLKVIIPEKRSNYTQIAKEFLNE